MTSSVVYSLCGMCNTRCPIEIHCEDSGPRWICGNRHLGSGTALCPRGAAGLGLYADDERPQQPLIREGARGEGRWRAASWDEALDYTAARLRDIMDTYGPRSLLFSERPGPCSDLSKALLRGLGSPNYCTHDDACSHNVTQAAYSLTGFGREQWNYDYRNCRHIVVQGRNLLESLKVGEVSSVLSALDRGCRLTCVDVRPTVTAAHASRNLCVRPGTDIAFNLGILHTLIAEKLYDAAFVAEYVRDFDALADFVRPCSAAWAAGECGIDAGEIVTLARQLAEAAPAVIWHVGWMSSRYAQSFMTCRTAYLINALLGSFGNKGGLILNAGAKDVGRTGLRSLASLYPAPAEPRADGVGWKEPAFAPGSSLLHKAFQAAVTGDPYPLKAYITLKHDPLSAMPDPESLKASLARFDFLVSLTFSWSDTAWFSDVILPMPSFVERGSLLQLRSGARPRIFMRRPAAAPRHDTRPDWWILGQLGKRLGLPELAFDTLEDLWRFQLEGTGIGLEDFRHGAASLSETPVVPALRFGTASGKIEVLFTPWEEAGIPSLRPYVSPSRPGPEEFRLIVGRHACHTHSHTQNNPLLHDALPVNEAWIAPARGQALGLADGDMAVMRAASGYSGRIRVRLMPGMHPEALFMLHGFGHSLPVESRARGLGLGDQHFMSGGLTQEDELAHGLALQAHFVRLTPCDTSAKDN